MDSLNTHNVTSTTLTPAQIFADTTPSLNSLLKSIEPSAQNTTKTDYNTKDSADLRNAAVKSSEHSEIESNAPDNTEQTTQNEGWITGGLRAVTGLATRMTVRTLEAAAPYLGAMADTAYTTAKTESPTLQRLEKATREAADTAKDLRALGKDMLISADRTAEHLATLKADRAAAEAASQALKDSGTELLKRMVAQGTVTTACVAGLGALQQMLSHGSTGFIASLPFATMPLGTVALAGSALALCSPQGVAFCRAAANMTQSLFSGGSAGADAATELAETAVSAQRAVGQVLTSMPSNDLLGLTH